MQQNVCANTEIIIIVSLAVNSGLAPSGIVKQTRRHKRSGPGVERQRSGTTSVAHERPRTFRLLRRRRLAECSNSLHACGCSASSFLFSPCTTELVFPPLLSEHEHNANRVILPSTAARSDRELASPTALLRTAWSSLPASGSHFGGVFSSPARSVPPVSVREVPTPKRLAMQTVDAAQSICPTTSQRHEPHCPPSPTELSYPSPVSEGLSGRAPFTPDAASSPPDPTALSASALADAIPHPPATTSLIPDTPTPSREILPDLGMSVIAATALPTPPIAKAARSNLRLPSFDLLGIAVPRPESISAGNQQATPFVGAGPLSQPEDPLHLRKSPFGTEVDARPSLGGTSPLKLLSDSAPSNISVQVPSSHKSIQQYILTQTPPDDNGKIDWSATSNIQAAPLASQAQGSAPMSDPSSGNGPSSSNGNPSTKPTSLGTPGFPGAVQAANPQNSPWLRNMVPLLCMSCH